MKPALYAAPPHSIQTRHVRSGERWLWIATARDHAAGDANETEAIRSLLYKLGCDTNLAEAYRNHLTDPDLVVLIKPEGYVEPRGVPSFTTWITCETEGTPLLSANSIQYPGTSTFSFACSVTW